MLSHPNDVAKYALVGIVTTVPEYKMITYEHWLERDIIKSLIIVWDYWKIFRTFATYDIFGNRLKFLPINIPAYAIEVIRDLSGMGAHWNQISCMQGNVTPPNKPCSTRITIIAVTDVPSHGVISDKIAGTPTPIPKICYGWYISFILFQVPG